MLQAQCNKVLSAYKQNQICEIIHPKLKKLNNTNIVHTTQHYEIIKIPVAISKQTYFIYAIYRNFKTYSSYEHAPNLNSTIEIQLAFQFLFLMKVFFYR